MNWLRHIRGKLLTSLLLGIIIMAVLGIISDVEQVGMALSTFRWGTLPLILGLTVLNYVLRWLKWDYYLRYLKMGDGVSRADSGLLFTAGMVMAVTPGKVGEVFKSYLLRGINGTPVSASAPIVLAERLTDGLGMLLLMALGLSIYPPARPAFVVLLVLSMAGIGIVQYRWLCERMLAAVARLPFGAKVAPKLTTLYESMAKLMDWRILMVSTLISVVSWGCECLAFYYVLTGLGMEGGALLLLQATFIFAASTLLGLVSFLPGGLGTSEASSAGLLLVLVAGMTAGIATTATIIIRFCTLWFGVALGVVALLWLSQRHRSTEAEALETAA
jgi:uncharacterized protein (TIRG00374 family)